jgi:hypothetical protein
MYTMPQRLTVAGEATARSSTSNIMVMLGDMVMISPDTKHSFMLSSSTADHSKRQYKRTSTPGQVTCLAQPWQAAEH